MTDLFEVSLPDADATVALGTTVADAVKLLIQSEPSNTQTPGIVFFLQGTLGAGKTTFSRGVIRGLGHTGAVKSPTYTLVEPYDTLQIPVFHFDLYRLSDPEELEFMGFRDYLDQAALLLIEWPSRGRGFLSEPDLMINLNVDDAVSPPGRAATFEAKTTKGQLFLEKLKI